MRATTHGAEPRRSSRLRAHRARGIARHAHFAPLHRQRVEQQQPAGERRRRRRRRASALPPPASRRRCRRAARTRPSSRSASPRAPRPRRTGSGSTAHPASRTSNTAIWPSKRIAAPDTSGLARATHARLIAWRVAKLSVQSSTTSACRHQRRRARRAQRAAGRVDTCTSGLIAASRARGRVDLRRADVGHRVQDLPLQIGEVDAVGVAQRERADAGAARNCAAGLPSPPMPTTSACGGGEPLLRVGPELVEQEVPAVAEELRVVHVTSQESGSEDREGRSRRAPVVHRLTRLCRCCL